MYMHDSIKIITALHTCGVLYCNYTFWCYVNYTCINLQHVHEIFYVKIGVCGFFFLKILTSVLKSSDIVSLPNKVTFPVCAPGQWCKPIHVAHQT